MSKVQVMDHPLIQHKISYIRSEEVGSKEFREIVGEIASLHAVSLQIQSSL